MRYSILLICFICAVLSCLMDRLFCGRKGKEQKLEKIAFYYIICIFMVSLYQCITGDIKESFLNCFTEATSRTYFRYGAVLLPSALIIPIVFRKIFRQKADAFINHFTNSYILLFAVGEAFFVWNTPLILCTQFLIGGGV